MAKRKRSEQIPPRRSTPENPDLEPTAYTLPQLPGMPAVAEGVAYDLETAALMPLAPGAFLARCAARRRAMIRRGGV